MPQRRLRLRLEAATDWLAERRLLARDARTRRTDRLLLAISAAVFIVAFAASALALPDLTSGLQPWLLVLAATCGVPLTIAANAAEYKLTATLAGRSQSAGDALRVSVVASAANLLPVPGAALVRARGIRQAGSTYGVAFGSTALVAGLFLAVTLLLAGATIAASGDLGTGTPLAAAGCVALAVAVAGVAAKFGSPVARKVVPRIILVEVASVAAGALRFWLIMRAFGYSPHAGQAFALMVGVVASNAAGFFPAGLGLRELLAAGISPVVGVPAALGVLTTAVDRLIGLAVLAFVAGGVLLTSGSTVEQTAPESE